MSRVGNKPIPLPPQVSVDIRVGEVTVRGPLGELKQELSPEMNVAIEDNTIVIRRPTDQRRHRAMHGLTRSLIANMVEGVSTGFRKNLEIVGVGYRVRKEGDRPYINHRFHPSMNSGRVQFTPRWGSGKRLPASSRLKRDYAVTRAGSGER